MSADMADNNGTLKRVRRQVLDCPRCGQCRSVCPVLAEQRDEASGPRGRVAMIKALQEQDLVPTKELEKSISQCTLCMRCMETCPSKVAVEDIVLAGREELANRLGIASVKQAAFYLIGKQEKLMPYLTKLGWAFQDIPFRRLPQNTGLRLRFPLGRTGRKPVVPRFARVPFKRRYRKSVGPNTAKARIAYFVGCFDNYFDTAIGDSVVEVLRRNGYQVVVPHNQGCCSIPMLASGVKAVALDLMKQNVEALEEANADFVVTSCGSCGGTLRDLYPRYLASVGETDYAERATKLAAKMLDISELLVRDGFEKPTGVVKAKVTYHDPCHLVRAQGVSKQPREILRSIPGVEFVEMKDADHCCGGAGTFNLVYYDLAKKVGGRKLANISATKADIVTTECPGCILYINEGLRREEMPQRVKHVIELLAESYKGTPAPEATTREKEPAAV